MLGVALSRAVNILLGGRPECLCARVHRRRWVAAEVVLDCAAVAVGSPPGHCARVAAWELSRRA